MLIQRRNKLVYPTGRRPGFNSKHIGASKLIPGAPVTSAIFGTGGTDSGILLTTGAPPNSIFAGGNASQFYDGILGPCLNSPYAGDNEIAFDLPNTPSSVGSLTMACIANHANHNIINFFSCGSGERLQGGAGPGVDGSFKYDWYRHAGQIHFSSTISAIPNEPIFIAVSCFSNVTTGDGGVGVCVANFVVKNLRTGQVFTDTATKTSGVDTLDRTSFAYGPFNSGIPGLNFGTIWFQRRIEGKMAAAMIAPNFLSVNELAQWAEDPWSFWYPENRIYAGAQGLYTQIDETVADDADIAKSGDNPSTDKFRVSLSDLPSGKTLAKPVQINYRYGGTSSTSQYLAVRLYEGSTLIAGWTHIDANSTYKNASQILTDAQFAAITNFNNLELEFEASNIQTFPSGLTASWLNRSASAGVDTAGAGGRTLNDAVLGTPVLTTGPDGVANHALLFSPQASCCFSENAGTFGLHLWLDTQVESFAMWIKVRDNSTTVGGNRQRFWSYFDAASQFTVCNNTAIGAGAIGFSGGSLGASEQSLCAPAGTLKNDKWLLLVATRDAANVMKLYVGTQGELFGEVTSPDTSNAITSLGSADWSYPAYADASAQPVCTLGPIFYWFNKKLTAAEALAVFQNPGG